MAQGQAASQRAWPTGHLRVAPTCASRALSTGCSVDVGSGAMGAGGGKSPFWGQTRRYGRPPACGCGQPSATRRGEVFLSESLGRIGEYPFLFATDNLPGPLWTP